MGVMNRRDGGFAGHSGRTMSMLAEVRGCGSMGMLA